MANINNNSEKQSSLSSDRLLQIIECLAKNRVPVRLQDLAEQTGTTQSTALRYLRTLQNANYVYQEEQTLRYALTWKVCRLAENLNSYLSLRNIANPFLYELSEVLQAGVCLVVNQDYESMYLDCVDMPNSTTSLQFIGKRAPMHVTGSGKLLLSSYSESRIDDYIYQKGLKQVTRFSITDKPALMQELEKIRRQGYGEDLEECEIGLRCASYPIYCYTGNIYAAISVFGSVEYMNEDFLRKEVHPRLKRAAAQISLRLGYSEA